MKCQKEPPNLMKVIPNNGHIVVLELNKTASRRHKQQLFSKSFSLKQQDHSKFGIKLTMVNQSILPCTCQLTHNKLKCDYQEIFVEETQDKKKKQKQSVTLLTNFLLRMIYYSVVTQVNSEKEIPNAPIRSRT